LIFDFELLAFKPDDLLFKLALVLVSGIIAGELVARINLPKVTGWIGMGILIRTSAAYHDGFTGLSATAVQDFKPYMSFVLGYIAFTVGAALHFVSLRNAGKRLTLLLLGEAVITPAIVFLSLFVAGLLLASDVMNIHASLVLCAIAIAGAPGTTVLVVQEARARGILTRTLVAAVALIDMVAVGAFTVVVALTDADAEMGHSTIALLALMREFGLALAIGATTSVIAILLNRTIVGPAFLGPTMVGVILASWGAAIGCGVSGILACTFAGIVVSNLQHDTVRSAEAYLHGIGGVLFAAFYTFAGMNLDFTLILGAAALVAVFFVARFAGKYAGAFAAMTIAGAPPRVRNYLGLALVPHGGVAVGLVLILQDTPHFEGIAEGVTTVCLAALAINQLVGPSGARLALSRAGETGKDKPRLLDFLDENHISVNISGATKEDVIKSLASQLYMTTDAPAVPQEEFVQAVLERETMETTCLSEGLMIPHAILEDGATITGMLGISAKGLDLGARDGPVHAVLLLATPKVERTRHLEVLAAFARAITRDINMREQLYHARNAAHAYDVLHAEDAEDINYFLEDAIARTRGNGDE